MKIARLYNQQGAYCREWKRETFALSVAASEDKTIILETLPGKADVALLVLNGHSLVIEELEEETT